ncbi:hypothetical protein RHMOL_Rhmol01G0240400 [Rhododendron molle]|uniref:Uncharacterized protein n=1 Tax=Rhododendron molle TaxID=49168 RepID=A0ACC0Q654_RHOML|nr:hypothetical protein RHMOL_Rhmol01G0240400 [Rhododendron molle]
MLLGEMRIYSSADKLCSTKHESNDQGMHPPELLHSLNFPGIPNHCLKLKVGTPIILLKNANLSLGLCNGTRLILVKMGHQDKSEELCQLVGTRYRDLIDSVVSVVLMKSSCESIFDYISSIHDSILPSLSSSTTPKLSSNPNPNRARTYDIACRVKYLVKTPEIIWGCLDKSMFGKCHTGVLSTSGIAPYGYAKGICQMKIGTGIVEDIPVCGTEKRMNMDRQFFFFFERWIVESVKGQISQRSKERLLDQTPGLEIAAYTDALAVIAIIDKLEPKQNLALFLDLRRSCICQKLVTCDAISAFCEVLRTIQSPAIGGLRKTCRPEVVIRKSHRLEVFAGWKWLCNGGGRG